MRYLDTNKWSAFPFNFKYFFLIYLFERQNYKKGGEEVKERWKEAKSK